MYHKVKLTHKNATTKKEMANSNRNVFDWVTLPYEKMPNDHNAGFIHTGEYEDQNFTLIVADFDLVPELKGRPYIYQDVEWLKRINKMEANAHIFTPSGGLHLYFLILGIHNIPNSAKWKTFDKNVVMDIRGHNGIIFSPLTHFPDEKYTDRYIPTKWNFSVLHDIRFFEKNLATMFGIDWDEKEKEKQGKTREIHLETHDWSFNNVREIEIEAGEQIVFDLNARQIYQRILDGLYIIPHGDVGPIKEFRIWKNLWLWAFWERIPFEYVMRRLRLNQPNFQEETTIQQLKFVDFAYRPSPDETMYLWNEYREHINLSELEVEKI